MWKWRISRSLSVGVNPVALAGVLTGVVSLFVPWLIIKRAHWLYPGWPPIFQSSETLSYVSIVFGEPPLEFSYAISMMTDLLFFTFLAMFLIGLMLSIASTLGGFPMVIGLIGQVLFGGSYFRDYIFVYEVSFAVGFYLALVSSAIILTCWGYSIIAGDKGESHGRRLLGQTFRLIREDGSDVIVIGRKGARRRAWRVNVLCLLGVSMGIAAVFMTWITTRSLGRYITPSGREWFSFLLSWPSVDMMLVSALCLAGLALSALSPLGGFLQIAGGAGCIAYLSYHLPMYWTVGIGPYIMVLAGIIIVLSARYPVWVGSAAQPPGPYAKFFTWSSFRKIEGRADIPISDQESLKKIELGSYHRFDVRINVIALFAAVLGALSLFLSWISWEPYPYPYTLLDISFYGSGQISLVCSLFIIGTVLLFFTPLGGFLQAASIPLIILVTHFHVSEWGEYTLHSGVAVGVSSFILAVISMILPTRKDARSTRSSLRDRLLNVRARRTSDAQTDYSEPPQAPGSSDEIMAEDGGRADGKRMYYRNFLRINLLSMIGALIAMISVFTYWIDIGTEYGGINLIRLLDIRDPDFSVVTMLFLIGATLSFVTPLGGLLQVMGVSFFFILVHGQEFIPVSVGPYLGLIAGTVVIAAGIFPIGVGYGRASRGRRARLRTSLLTMTLSEAVLVFTDIPQVCPEEDGDGHALNTHRDSGESTDREP